MFANVVMDFHTVFIRVVSASVGVVYKCLYANTNELCLEKKGVKERRKNPEIVQK